MSRILPLNDLHALAKSRKAKDGEPVELIENGQVIGYYLPAKWVEAQPQGNRDPQALIDMLRNHLKPTGDAT
ncbi:hypothetical protein [Neogemmobacter tilapiae]|uniref:Uncharacterized protein n=1 Tax=Neogemmobacter tilapiae TaxID=875041 RepID=A0A918WGA2_9RHOB|nr:hypothetical protein [Gemmobacter tilapiae]GHC44884.1 hypothetical protein GCM10007315_02700 [Gemmobacter tilapiae]